MKKYKENHRELAKELFELIMNMEVIRIDKLVSTIRYEYETTSEEDGEIIYIKAWGMINVFEFVDKCKKYIISEGYTYLVGFTHHPNHALCELYLQENIKDVRYKTIGEDEAETIFKAVKWVKDKHEKEVDVLKEKYATNDYILLLNFQDSWFKWDKIEPLMLPRHKLIHKRHEEVLNAYIEDNSVVVQSQHTMRLDGNTYREWAQNEGSNWIEHYDEEIEYFISPLYLVKKQQENPKTKIAKEYLCYNNGYYTKVSEFEPLFAIQILREIEVPNV